MLDAAPKRAPRMVEVRLRWSKSASIAGHQPGGAALAASKDVYLQRVADDEARVIVFAAGNTERIESGVLAELATSGSGQLEIVPMAPMMAPAEAEEGLLVGDPVQL
jgi:hypothetical protein